MARILIIDRSPESLAHHLQAGREIGHVIDTLSESRLADRWVARRMPDVIVVGRLADDVFRNDLCRQLRRVAPAGRSAIVALVAASAQLTRIRCLEDGADGVIDTDATPDQLWSRINALLPLRDVAVRNVGLAYGMIDMDVEGHKVFAAGVPLALNHTSFSILRHFLEHPEQIMSRQDISRALGRLHQQRTIDVHIRNLRQALKVSGADQLVVTVPQAGYMLCDRAACECRGLVTIASSGAVAR